MRALTGAHSPGLVRNATRVSTFGALKDSSATLSLCTLVAAYRIDCLLGFGSTLFRLSLFCLGDLRTSAPGERFRRSLHARLDARRRSRIGFFETRFNGFDPGAYTVGSFQLDRARLGCVGFLASLCNTHGNALDPRASPLCRCLVGLGARCPGLGAGLHVDALCPCQRLTFGLEDPGRSY